MKICFYSTSFVGNKSFVKPAYLADFVYNK